MRRVSKTNIKFGVTNYNDKILEKETSKLTANVKMPNKMPNQNLNKIYDNSIESSVLSSKSLLTPRKQPTNDNLSSMLFT